MRVVAIVAAGGRGTRLGTARPKQFLDSGGRPIPERSVSALLECPLIELVVVALAPEVAARPPSYLTRQADKVVVVAGGDRRQDSVANAFAAVPLEAEVVVIHDAARPFVDRVTIERTIAAAASGGAAICALQARDTVKLADVTEPPAAVPAVKRTLPREKLDLAQTPQAFSAGVLAEPLRSGTRAPTRPTRRRWPNRPGTTVACRRESVAT